MARKYTSGAEIQSTGADVEVDSTSGSTIAIDTAVKRTGAASWKFTAAASGPFVTRQYTSSNGDSYVRAYIYVQSMTTAVDIAIILIRDGTSGNNANIRLNRDSASTFHLELWNEQAGTQVGSDSATLSTATWYRVEFNYVRSTGAMSARVDGTQFASGTGSTTLNSNTIRWGSIDSSTMTINFDDIAVNDATGSFQNSWPGEGGVFRINPNNSGDVNTFATQTGGTAGAANNFTRVDETTPNDATDFNGSSTLNQEDLFNFDPSGIGSSDTVNVVEVWGRHRNSTADATAAIRYEIEKTGSGTITQSSAIVPNSTTWRTNAAAVPKTPPIVLYQDPDAAAWTQTTLDTLQAGYKLTVAPGTAGRRIDVSWVMVQVDYTPSSSVSASITQVAATVTATGGAQAIDTINNVSVIQAAASVTMTGGVQSISTINNISIGQLAANAAVSGGTQAVTSVQNQGITQVSANLTASGGNQIVSTVNNVAISQTAASATMTGGTQAVSTGSIVNASVVQVTAFVTATSGLQTVASSQTVGVTQLAATLTAGGGVQIVNTVRNSTVTQVAATLTATGAMQVVSTVRNGSVTQEVATLVVTGGSQTVSASRGASVIQTAANITLLGGVQVVDTVVVSTIPSVPVVLNDTINGAVLNGATSNNLDTENNGATISESTQATIGTDNTSAILSDEGV